jgi:hypothetical protein
VAHRENPVPENVQGAQKSCVVKWAILMHLKISATGHLASKYTALEESESVTLADV